MERLFFIPICFMFVACASTMKAEHSPRYPSSYAQGKNPILCENDAVKFGSSKQEAAILCARGADAYSAKTCVVESEKYTFFERNEALQICSSGKAFIDAKLCVDKALEYSFNRRDAIGICSSDKDPFEVKSCLNNLTQAGVSQELARASCF